LPHCILSRVPTANEILGEERLAVLRHVRTAIDLERAALVVADAVRVKGRISANLDAALLQILNEQALNHALVHKQNIRVDHIYDGRVVDFSAESMKRFVCRAAPKGDVVDSDAAL
jgi:hypothetical protein